MARRPDTESEESSQNIDEKPLNVKQEKNARAAPDDESVSQDGANDNGAEEQEDGEQRGSEEEEEEEEEEEDEIGDEDDEEEGEEDGADESPKGRKRSRVNDDGDSVKAERNSTRRPSRPAVLPRDTDGYVPGSIVRVKLHQFLTYDDVEFSPGPYLNMILGPNGTGKSSIACAICLGLNWPPSVLKRASKLGSFVKQGCHDGFIEIELKGPIGEPNLVIRRLLTDKMERTQTFLLNGETVPGKLISEHVESLGIQVNNLCSFLPQDKVAEFAQMTPQQLLRETQKAAGNEKLTKWHDYLIQAGKDVKQLETIIIAERKELETLEQRNSNLEKEVQAYQLRREIERQIELLQLILPFKEYLDARTEYDKLKKDRETLHLRVTALKKRNEPVEEFKEGLEKRHKEAEKEREKRKGFAKDKFTDMKRLWRDNEDLQGQSETVHNDLLELKKRERQRREKIQNLTKEIHKLEVDIAHPPPMDDKDAIDAELRANLQKVQEAERDKHELELSIMPFVDESSKQDVRIRGASNDIQNLDNAAHRKLEGLDRWDRTVANVVRWLRQNQHCFRMPVIEPACLSIDVPDPRYADAVEAGFTAMQMKTFVFQCQEDYKLFNRLIIDTGEGMGSQYRVATWFREIRPESIPPPPLNPAEMQQLGFDAYAIDCVTFPEAMRPFLLDVVSLHRFAIALNPPNFDFNRAMDMVSRILPNGKGGGGSFVAGRVCSTVTRSRYGLRKPQAVTRDIRRSMSFTHAPVDQERKRNLQNSIAQANQLKSEAEAEVAKISQKISAVESAIKEISKQRAEIEGRKKKLYEDLRKLQALGLRLTQKQTALQNEENAPSVDEARQRLRQKGFEIAKDRAKIAKRLQVIIKSVIDDNRKATIAGLEYFQIGANKAALEELVKARDTEYKNAMLEYAALDQEFLEMKAVTKQKLKDSKAKLAEIDDELRKTFEEMEESGEIGTRDCEEIKQELENLRAQLELNQATNSGVIEQYEQRLRQIERLRAKVLDREAEKARMDRKIQKTKDRWLPALQDLIANIGEKFSAAFDRVNCAGEIQIAQHEYDYAAWAIDILVKFRDNEDLQLLTGQRQSGGERALTTIMYLMSLTELARVPFSLVDEINQGMDARYERAVHDSLVDVTCRADSGQYFLITPKLLTDLKYHERMKVLCVSNGEWLPDELPGGNMMRMIDSYLARRGRAQ